MQGPWSPSKIANPDYFLDEEPLANVGKVGGVAIEVWTMDNNYYFSNILVDQDPSVAEKARDQYWQPKKALEVGTKKVTIRNRSCPACKVTVAALHSTKDGGYALKPHLAQPRLFARDAPE